MQLGMDLVRQAREAAKSNSVPASRDRQMAEAHRAALVRYEGQVRQHQGRVAGAKAGVVAGGAGTAVLGLSTLASAGSPGQMLFLGGLTAGTAALGWRARRRAKDLEAHPPVPQLPPLPPARLRPGARGADPPTRVANAVLHLYDLVPNVGGCTRRLGRSCGARSVTSSPCCAARRSGWHHWTESSGRCLGHGPPMRRSRPGRRSRAGCALAPMPSRT